MPLITSDDWIETWQKLRQRGLQFVLSKFSPDPLHRTRSAFDDSAIEAANWWIVPAVRRRWNLLATGDPDQCYEDYTVARYFAGRQNLHMLALGCGIGSHERQFARHACFEHIDACDVAANLVQAAQSLASQAGLTNIHFAVADVNRMALPPEQYDAVMFHSSLHHFLRLDHLLGEKVYRTLRPGGLVIINEYVGTNRHQWSPCQLAEVNRILREEIPLQMRRRFKTGHLKRSVSGPGLLRMYLADPSEAAESEAILPVLRRHFTEVELKNLGGNLLMLLLKDIAHHFLAADEATSRLLERLFVLEDAFLRSEASHMVFGIYRKG